MVLVNLLRGRKAHRKRVNPVPQLLNMPLISTPSPKIIIAVLFLNILLCAWVIESGASKRTHCYTVVSVYRYSVSEKTPYITCSRFYGEY